MGPIRKLLFPAVAAAVSLVILLNLGFWQLDRLAYKENLIQQVEDAITNAPVPGPSIENGNTVSKADDYRHVQVTGEFLDGVVYYYIALSDPAGPIGGPGLMAYQPFKTTDGWTVFVNRGFLPQSLEDDQKAQVTVPPEGQMTISGLLRLSERPNWATPDADLNARIWFARDTDAMGEFLKLDPQTLAPYSIDLDAEFTPASGLPQAGETIVRFKNDHLGYALTWFGLAATLIGVFLAYAATVLWPRKTEE